MSRCTLAMASNAASIAAFMSDRARPATAISTNVPRRGRARRTLSPAVAIERDDPLDAFGHVKRRQRRAGNIADIAADPQRTAAGLSDELPEPAGVPDLAAVGLAILQNLDPMDAPARVQGDGIVDIEMLADHVIDDEDPQRPASGLRLPGAAVDRDKVRRGRECLFPGLVHGEVLNRIRGRCDRYDRRGRRSPAHPFSHGSLVLLGAAERRRTDARWSAASNRRAITLAIKRRSRRRRGPSPPWPRPARDRLPAGTSP